MKSKCYMPALLALLIAGGCGDKETARTVPPVKVRTLTVGDVGDALSQGYLGTIEEMSATALSFPMGGTIKQMLVDEGQMVKQGQLVATVDATTVNNGLEAARATTSQAGDIVQQAQDTYAQALDAYNRMKILHDNGSLPEIQWIEAETRLKQAETAVKTAQSGVKSAQASERIARKGLDDTRLLAPTSGYAARRQAEVGQNVLPGAPVIYVLKIDRVKVKFSVPEDEISSLVVGQQIDVKVAALDGRAYKAQIAEKSINADPLSRTYEVKAVIDNADRRLLPGMVADVVATHASAVARVITLPVAAIELGFDNTTFVWTVADGKAQKTHVTTGDNLGGRVTILAGLKPGDKVIVEGQQKVSSGMTVNELAP